MQVHRVLLILIALCCAVGRAQAQDSDSAVARAQRARFAAMIAGDLPALDTLVDDGLVYTHTDGEVQNKSQFLQTVRSGEIKYLGISPSEVRVRLIGNDVAVVTGKSHMTLAGSSSREFDIRFIDVEVQRRGRWMCVDWQSTRIP